MKIRKRVRKLERTMTMRAARARRKITWPTIFLPVKSTEPKVANRAVHIVGYLAECACSERVIVWASEVPVVFVFTHRRFCGSFYIGVLYTYCI